MFSSYKLSYETQTSLQLGDDTLLQSTRGAVDFSLHLPLCPIQTHCKGCWVIHLQTRLLPRPDAQTVSVQSNKVTLGDTNRHSHTNTQSKHCFPVSGFYSTRFYYSLHSTSAINLCVFYCFLLLPELLLVELQQTEAGGHRIQSRQTH